MMTIIKNIMTLLLFVFFLITFTSISKAEVTFKDITASEKERIKIENDLVLEEKSMNESYSKLLAADQRLDSEYQNKIRDLKTKHLPPPDYAEQLKNAQHTWIEFRESHCNYLSTRESYSNSLERKTKNLCMLDMTTNRAFELKNLLRE